MQSGDLALIKIYCAPHRCRCKQIFGGAKDFCPYFPKLAEKLLCDFYLQIFSHRDHEDLFWCDLQKKGFHLFFFCKRWEPFFDVKQRWEPFPLRFLEILLRNLEILPRFSEILPKFWRILPKFSTNQDICEGACTVSYTTCVPWFVYRVRIRDSPDIFQIATTLKGFYDSVHYCWRQLHPRPRQKL